MIACILLGTAAITSHAASFGIDGASFSVSTWRLGSDNTGSGARASWFNTAEANLYYHIGSIKGFIGLPVMLTLLTRPQQLEYAFYPADMPLYFGIQWGFLEPRIGVRIPLGYPVVDTVPWIGSGTLQIITATGFNLGTHLENRLKLHGELRARISATGLASGARVGRGSTSWYLYTNATWRLNERWTMGIEVSPYGDYFPESDWSNETWYTLGVMPLVLLRYNSSSHGSFAVRAGAGTEYSGTGLETVAPATTIALTWSRF